MRDWTRAGYGVLALACWLGWAVVCCRGTDRPGSDADLDADTDLDADVDLDAATETDTPAEIDWVTIPGGSFMMGDPDPPGTTWDQPVHEVTVTAFQMSRTEVTRAQYQVCVTDGACTEPGTWEDCVWEDPDAGDTDPINCLTWYQAREFAEWVGGRLPSEAEWEYAARSGGKDYYYPWGNEEPTCENTVMAARYDQTETCRYGGCNECSPCPVCSKHKGNTEQGLCNMAGNVQEMVEDDFHESYEDAPSDGSAWVDEPRGMFRILRGGSYCYAWQITNRRRLRMEPDTRPYVDYDLGFRIARSVP